MRLTLKDVEGFINVEVPLQIRRWEHSWSWMSRDTSYRGHVTILLPPPLPPAGAAGAATRPPLLRLH